MAIVRCTQCHLPMTGEEARDPTCPCCGAALTPNTPPTPGDKPATPADTSSRRRTPLVILGAAILAAVVAGVVAFSLSRPDPADARADNAPPGGGQPQAREKPSEADAPAITNPETTPQQSEPEGGALPPEPIHAPKVVRADEPVTPVPEQIPAPKVAAQVPPPPGKKPQPKVAAQVAQDQVKQGPPPAGLAGEVLADRERRLNRPDREYLLPEHQGAGPALKVSGKVKSLMIGAVSASGVVEVEKLEAQELWIGRIDSRGRVTVSGKVKTLVLGSMSNYSVLDASQLEAEEVTLSGPIEGQARVKLNGHLKALRVGAMNRSAALEVLGLDAREITFTKRLDTHSKVTLGGKVGRMVLSEIGGRAQVDTTQLTARSVICAGRIEGQARVRLHAPGGTVEFRNPVQGARLEVTAPGGKVTFAQSPDQGQAGGRIDNSVKAHITAREAEFRTITGGGTLVVVTLTANGALRFGTITGNMRLEYRKADAADPEPVVQAGVIQGKAKLEMVQ